jgi:hypothetical protein
MEKDINERLIEEHLADIEEMGGKTSDIDLTGTIEDVIERLEVRENEVRDKYVSEELMEIKI